MSIRTEPWPAGTPNWVDLTTSDREAAWDFYRDVMGWTITDSGPDYGHYGMADVDGRPAAGLMERQPGDTAPPRWTTYFAADSVNDSAKTVTAHAGKVIVGPMDVPDQGRMAVAIDPTGAVFGLWQPDGHIGYQHVNEPGGVVWNQLASPDPAAAKTFYASVFGHTYTDMGEMATINGDGPGGTIGGLGPLDAGNPEAQPQWSVTFSVAGADATTARAKQLGATAVFGPVDSEWGRMATLRDPQGAEFGIIGATAP